jgi:hypothetical protein
MSFKGQIYKASTARTGYVSTDITTQENILKTF